MELSVLADWLLGIFADEDDDDEALADLRLQLDYHPNSAAIFRQQLSALIASGDTNLCSQLLKRSAMRWRDPADSMAWFEWLQAQLLDRPT